MKHRMASRPPTSAAQACAAQKSHAPLRGEENRHASSCQHCSVPVERLTTQFPSHTEWRAFCWSYVIFEEPDLSEMSETIAE